MFFRFLGLVGQGPKGFLRVQGALTGSPPTHTVDEILLCLDALRPKP